MDKQTKSFAFTSMSAALLCTALVFPSIAIEGTNSGNFRDGLTAAKAFCWPIADLAFELSGSDRDPVQGDYDQAALEIGSKVEAVYGANLPADHRRAFRAGFEKGASACKQI